MNILSLFDGISIAQQALNELGYDFEYYASEIDKNAISVATRRHPKTHHLGDVKAINTKDLPNITLLVGGSPCQDLSIASINRKGLSGARSGLFYEYVRILKETLPPYFVLENVNSMSADAKDAITLELFGVKPVMINASDVSAQNRKRLFWVGKRIGDTYVTVELPPIKRVDTCVEDILVANSTEKTYANDLPASAGDVATKSVRLGSIGKAGQGNRIYSSKGKSVCLSANSGGRGAKTGLYQIASGLCRPLGPVECERLQSLPDDYTAGASRTQRLKMLGNGFNCAVMKHIISNLNL